MKFFIFPIKKWLLANGLLLFMTITSLAQTYKYGNVKLGGGGFVSGIITCPAVKNLIYARTDVGGAYRWNDTTGAWIPLVDWINEGQVGYSGIEALAIDPNAPSKLYMLAGINYFNGGQTAILRSNDYGATFSITNVTAQFKAHGNGGGRQNGERLAVDPNKGTILFCGTRSNGLFKSIDAGVSWTNVASFPANTTNNGNGVCLVVFDKTTGTTGNATQTIYAGVSRMGTDNFYVSKDGGTTWNPVAGQNNAFMPQRVVIANDGNMYITYANGCGPGGSVAEPMGDGSIMKYNTKTGAWTNVSPVIANNTLAFGGISVDATNPKRLIATTINKYMAQPLYPGNTNTPWGDRIFVSADGGTTWTDLIGAKKFQFNTGGSQWVSGSAIHWAGSIEFDPNNPDRAFVASGNGIFMSANLSAAVTTWTFTTNGLEETVPRDAVSIPGGPFAWVMYDYDGCVQSDVNVSAQTHQPGIGTTTGIDYAGKNTSYMVRVGGWDQTKPTAYYTTNSGASWTACGKPTGTSAQGKVGVNADGTVIVWVPNGQANAYYSTNNGANWTQCNGFNVQNGRVVGDRVNPQKFYVYNNGVIYVSTDAGKNFTAAGNAGAGGSIIIRPVPDVEGDIWVALQGGGLTRSTNSGATFNKITTVTSCRSVGFGKATTGKTFPSIYIWGKVGAITGIFRSDDTGATWTRVNDDNHQWGGPGNGEFVIGDMNIYGRYYMSSAGRGVVYGEIDNTPQNIKVSLASSTNILCANQTVVLTATPTLTSGTLKKLEFYEGTTLLSTITKAPYTDTILATTNGIHNYTVKATSSLNETATSQSISIQVGSSAVITPYLQINAGAWAQTNIATLCSGGMVVAGPQPATTTGWSWKGPNNYIATTREITLGGMTPAQTGKYTAFYDDGSGCPATMDITITVNVTSIPTVTTPLTYNMGATATVLTATGTGLKWYTAATGGTALAVAPIPNTATIGTTSYYVSQTTAPCGEGNRTKIDVTVVNPVISKTIQLDAGWNLISINVMPTDSSIATLFKGLDVLEIKTMDAFWRKGQTLAFNGLKNISSANGYLVYMNTPGTLSIQGMPTSTTLPTTKTGWNLIGCPYQASNALSSLFNTSNISSVKNFDGFWTPNGTTNSILTIDPGKGYFAKGQ